MRKALRRGYRDRNGQALSAFPTGMLRAIAVLAVVLTSCGVAHSPTASHGPTPAGAINSGTPVDNAASRARAASPNPVTLGALPLAILVKDFLVEGGPTYTASLVGLDGRVSATATGSKRSHPTTLIQMPSISASDTRLYYLDGDSKVMYLRPDGQSGLATTIPVDTNSAAVFAVSPDDTRIAVAILTFPYPAKTRIYVEDLAGGGNHVELFSSTTSIEWPVGWHQGHLVIGVGANARPQNAWEGFEWAYEGYHVADATTGDRIATVCPGYGTFSTPPVPAGTMCVRSPKYEVSDWNGATRPIPQDAGCGGGALSPDGSLVADCQGNPRTATLVAVDGSMKTTPYAADALGWVDANHVVVHQDADSSNAILDVSSLLLVQTGAKGFFAGTIPGRL